MKRFLAIALTLLGLTYGEAQVSLPPLNVGKLLVHGRAIMDSAAIFTPQAFYYGVPGSLGFHIDTLKLKSLNRNFYLSMEPATVGQILVFGSDSLWKPGNGSDLGLGTVTSFADAGLDSLFTSVVTNPTTAVSVTHDRVSFPAHTWWGNPTGSTATPGPRSLSIDDLPVSLTRRAPVAKLVNWATSGGNIDSQYVCTVFSNVTIDSIIVFQRGASTCSTNVYKNHGGTVSALLSANVAVTSTRTTAAGLQNNTAVLNDEFWIVIKSILGTATEIDITIVYRITS